MPSPSAPFRVVVAVFDGLRADLVRPDLTPNILRLARRGTWFREARSVFPSVTRVCTTSIATGAPPAVHGIMGNGFYHPEVLPEEVLDTSERAHILAAETHHRGHFVTTATLGDRLAQAGRRMAVVHTGSPGSAHMINPRAGALGHWTFSVHGASSTATPDAVAEVVGQLGPLPPRSLPRFEEIAYGGHAMVDHVLPRSGADVSLVWFNEPDTSFHYRGIGHPESWDVLRATDAAFGRILDWVEAQPDADRIAVIAASDHGQIATSGHVALADRGRSAGFRIGEDDSLSGAALVMTGGRYGEIRVREDRPGLREDVALWLMEQPEVSHVFSRVTPGQAAPIEGTLPLSAVSVDHARQPDLMFVLGADDGPDADGLPGQGMTTPGDVPVGGGMHGGLHPGELNTVLVVSAPGLVPSAIVSDRPAGLIDIAPTILDLNGLSRAEGMVGTSLARPALSAAETRVLEAGRGRFSQRVELVEEDGRRFIRRG